MIPKLNLTPERVSGDEPGTGVAVIVFAPSCSLIVQVAARAAHVDPAPPQTYAVPAPS